VYEQTALHCRRNPNPSADRTDEQYFGKELSEAVELAAISDDAYDLLRERIADEDPLILDGFEEDARRDEAESQEIAASADEADALAEAQQIESGRQDALIQRHEDGRLP
jgi:hypothetical protein